MLVTKSGVCVCLHGDVHVCVHEDILECMCVHEEQTNMGGKTLVEREREREFLLDFYIFNRQINKKIFKKCKKN